MLRNLFLLVPFLLLVHVTSAAALPACEGSPLDVYSVEQYHSLPWHNCVGDITVKDPQAGIHLGAKWVAEWKDGKPHGHGTYIYATGEKYVGEYRDGSQHGQGTLTHADGDKYVGEFKFDNYQGHGTYTYADDSPAMGWGRSMASLELVGEFANGFASGNVTLYWANGDVWVGRVSSDADALDMEWLGGNKYTAGNVPPEVYAARGGDVPPPIEPAPSDYLPPATPTSYSMSIEQAKSECEELGFEPKTEKYGDCVLKLIEMN